MTADTHAPVADIDGIITALYRRFKEWSKRGFGPEDVTWCEVKADILALIAAQPASTGGMRAALNGTMQQHEEQFCTCGAGHGSLEGHVDWCHWLKLKPMFEALESANQICRSALSIAERKGSDVNWEAFRLNLRKSLELQHAVLAQIDAALAALAEQKAPPHE